MQIFLLMIPALLMGFVMGWQARNEHFEEAKHKRDHAEERSEKDES